MFLCERLIGLTSHLEISETTKSAFKISLIDAKNLNHCSTIMAIRKDKYPH
jgi:hypothetical protein